MNTFHSLSWILWLCAAVVAASATRNPLYLVLILLCLFIVAGSIRPVGEARPPIVSPVTFAAIVTLLATAFNALTTHYGQTVIIRVPEGIPIVGGNITLEAVIYGLTNGLTLSALFAAFTVLNLALPIRALIQYIPRAFSPLAVVTSIAVSFVPVTLRQFGQIREAQAVRGHRLRGVRDWLPLFLPLLTGGLERALQLAEAMAARGFARADEKAHNIRMQVMLVVGLATLPAGLLLRLAWGQKLWGLLLLLAGGGLVLAVFWLISRQVPRTVYRRERWSWSDGVVLVGAGVVLVVFLTLLPGIDRKALYYSPYPALTLPPFDPLVGLAILGLAGPLVSGMRERDEGEG
jgi:energy-coupling factor transport system permease protein